MTNKILEKVYYTYRKANKAAKKRMLEIYGYKTEQEFLIAAGILKPEDIIVAEKKPAKKATKKKTSTGDLVDYVIAFDTTGSMAPYLDGVRKHVRELIPNLFKQIPNLQMRVIAFGDYCDMESKTKFGRAYQESAFTTNENDLIEFVNRAQSTSGGDADEFYELVIHKITNETPWRKGSKRNVLFIGDCNPHNKNYQYRDFVTTSLDWTEEAQKASKLGIQFDTLSIQGYDFYEVLAKITGGICTPFKNAKKMDKIVEMAMTSRYNKTSFKTAYARATADGDLELMGAYKSYSTL